MKGSEPSFVKAMRLHNKAKQKQKPTKRNYKYGRRRGTVREELWRQIEKQYYIKTFPSAAESDEGSCPVQMEVLPHADYAFSDRGKYVI